MLIKDNPREIEQIITGRAETAAVNFTERIFLLVQYKQRRKTKGPLHLNLNAQMAHTLVIWGIYPFLKGEFLWQTL